MPEIPELLETPRLVLRRAHIEDAAALNDLVIENIEHLRPFMHWIPMEPLTVTEREELIEGWSATGDNPYLIHHGDELIGVCGTHRRIGPGGIEIGYWLDEGAVGNGYMAEAVAEITTALFVDPTIDHVEIHHDRANTRSRTIPDRIGYTLVDERSDEITAPGQVGVSLIWSVTRDEWSAIQK